MDPKIIFKKLEQNKEVFQNLLENACIAEKTQYMKFTLLRVIEFLPYKFFLLLLLFNNKI